MKLSLIIPIYNESAVIGPFVEELKKLPADVEVLFADGGCSDDTLSRIADRYGVISCPKGRARQMNAAATQATGDVLWFLHCDSRLPPNAAEDILQAVAQGAHFGCFHIGFDQGGFWMACNTFFSNARVRLWRVAFGDQGIFLTRSLFEELGGWPDLPIMEDLELSRRVKKKKIPLRQLPGRIITSARRYRSSHPLRTMVLMFTLRCRYRMGGDIEDIARRYRDIR